MSIKEKMMGTSSVPGFQVWGLICAIVGVAHILSDFIGQVSKWIFIPLALVTILAFGLSLLKLPIVPIARQVAKHSGIGAMLFGIIWGLQSLNNNEIIESPPEQFLEAEVPVPSAVIPEPIPDPEQSDQPPPPKGSIVAAAPEGNSTGQTVPLTNRAEETSPEQERTTLKAPAPGKENECETALQLALESEDDAERGELARVALSCPDTSFARRAAEAFYTMGDSVLRRQAVIYFFAPGGKGRQNLLILVPSANSSTNAASERADGLMLKIRKIDSATGDFSADLSSGSGARVISGTVGRNGVSFGTPYGPFSFTAEDDFYLRGTFRDTRSGTVAAIEISLN